MPTDLSAYECSPAMAKLDAVPDLAEEVGECVAAGERLVDIARRFGVRRGQLKRWLDAEPERLAEYHAGLSALADEMAMETIKIADEGDLDRNALQVKARQWLSSKLDRGRFGESGTAVSVGVGVKVVLSRDDVGML